MSYFQPNDLVFYRERNEDDTSRIMSGGYSIQSFLLKESISPMTTLDGYTKESFLSGGNASSEKNKVSDLFENLAVPAGLFYANPTNYSSSFEVECHTTLSDDIHDKLFSMVEMNTKHLKKTRKNKERVKNKKTRRG